MPPHPQCPVTKAEEQVKASFVSICIPHMGVESVRDRKRIKFNHENSDLMWRQALFFHPRSNLWKCFSFACLCRCITLLMVQKSERTALTRVNYDPAYFVEQVQAQTRTPVTEQGNNVVARSPRSIVWCRLCNSVYRLAIIIAAL